MARYTLNLYEIVETLLDASMRDLTMNPYDYIDTLCEAVVPVIFSNKVKIYVIDDNPTPERREIREADRMELLKKILKHYWDYEVCCTTPYDFIFRLNKKLDEIMPYFNRLYASAELEFDPFNDVDYTRNIDTSKVDKTIDDGRITTDRTGDDTRSIANGGVDTERYTGNENMTHTGTDTEVTAKTGTDTVITDGEKKKTGTETLGLNETKGTNTGTGGVKWDFFNDTPEGRVNWGNNNIPDSSPAPDGDGLPDGDRYDMHYLTRYEKHVDAGSHVNTTETKTGTDTTTFNTKEENDVTERTNYNSNVDDRLTYNNTVDTDDTHTETTEYGKTVHDKIDYNNSTDTKKDNVRDYTHNGNRFETVRGKKATVSYSERLLLFRNTIINIDELIIQALRELFFKII